MIVLAHHNFVGWNPEELNDSLGKKRYQSLVDNAAESTKDLCNKQCGAGNNGLPPYLRLLQGGGRSLLLRESFHLHLSYKVYHLQACPTHPCFVRYFIYSLSKRNWSWIKITY